MIRKNILGTFIVSSCALIPPLPQCFQSKLLTGIQRFSSYQQLLISIAFKYWLLVNLYSSFWMKKCEIKQIYFFFFKKCSNKNHIILIEPTVLSAIVQKKYKGTNCKADFRRFSVYKFEEIVIVVSLLN